MNSENAPSYAGSAPVAGVTEAAAPSGQRFVPSWRRFKGLAIYTAILVVVFGRALYALITFAPSAELYSHILLIPFISAYLIWIKRGQVVMESKPNRRMALLPAAMGLLVLAGYRVALGHGWTFAQPDYLAVMTFSFLLFLVAGCFIFVEANYLKSITFPLAFLFFCIPFPEVVRFKIETFFQFGSADVAYVMLKMSGMPVLKIGTRFLLPSMSIEVAPECSGVHSSLILFVTSVLAAHLFLKTNSRRAIFVLFVIPLAFLRNGFRVFTIAQLCVRVGPQMIDSWIHHHGGPVFFVLSLVPLFFLLMYLTKSETRKEQAVAVSVRK